MASPHHDLIITQSFFILSLFLIISHTTASATTNCINTPPSSTKNLSDAASPSAGRIVDCSSSLGTVSMCTSSDVVVIKEENGNDQSGLGHYKLKVVVAWAVGFGFMGLLVLGAWLMRRSIKIAADKVVALDI
ncbi:hypothetical protein CRG98_042784 [Punica granatum]|nr:hypothetical protein CRG98_042784 [Punica granatum]